MEVAHVWLRRGNWHGLYLLDETVVESISSFLTPPRMLQGKPYHLASNENKSFEGSKVYSAGFVLKPIEAQSLLAKDSCNYDVLFPYLNGEDVNSRPDQSPSRWVINFFDWPLERAEMYHDCMKIVREKVKPERELSTNNNLREKWWLYERSRPALYSAIAGMKFVLVKAQISKYHSFVFVPTGTVYNQRLIIFSLQGYGNFAQLQSQLHTEWVLTFGSTLETRPVYTSKDCFETFPLAKTSAELEITGEQYHLYRQSIMQFRQEGLTDIYNRFHEPEEIAEDIVKLRALHKEMDEAVTRAYGWDDLDLGHGFHETKQGMRYTISEEARREVLGRLLKLNHERYAEEVAQGLHEKGGKKGGGKKSGGGGKEHGVKGEQGELVFE